MKKREGKTISNKGWRRDWRNKKIEWKVGGSEWSGEEKRKNAWQQRK
jgi:hypothetical protein